MWSGLLWAFVAATAGFQIVSVWQEHQLGSSTKNPDDRSGAPTLLPGLQFRVVAAVCAGVVPLLAAYGTGTAGLALMIIPVLVVAAHVLSGQGPLAASATIIGAVLPAIAAASVVFAVRVDLWAGLFLVVAVSIYDAGSFLLGAEAGSRWEGPAAGMIGALAVTFTMAAFHPSPFDGATAWIAGVVVALMCPLGQILAGIFLPTPDARVPALRRLDGYLVAGPAFLVCAAAASL